MDELYNVSWVVFEEYETVNEVPIIKSICRDELLANLRQKKYEVPAVKEHQELCIRYWVNDVEVLIDLVNNTSDVESEHYSCDTDALVFVTSVQDDCDYVGDYNDAMLRAQGEGRTLTQEEFFANE